MKRIIFANVFIGIVLVVPSSALGKTTAPLTEEQIRPYLRQIESTTDEVGLLRKELEDTEENYRTLYDGLSQQNDRLSDQISWTNALISIFAFVFTVVGVVLGIWIGKKYDEIKEIEKIAKDTQEDIDSKAEKTYEKLRRQDTVGLLRRLEAVPEDIQNIGTLLFSRDLLECDFAALKNIYLKVKNDSSADLKLPGAVAGETVYAALLFQHFPYQVAIDREIADMMIDGLGQGLVSGMFERDLARVFAAAIRILIEKGYDDESGRKFLKKIFSALYVTRHKKLIAQFKTQAEAASINLSLVKSILEEGADPEYLKWISTLEG
jgi:hypothetical protein